MLSKRRQSTSVQVIALITLLCLVGYFIFPRKPSAATYSDSWYEEDGLVDMTSSQKELAAIAAAAVEAKQAIQEPTRKVMNTNGPGRVKGAFVILARNSDLNGVRHSMRQVEDRFNRNFNYPYVFLNEKDFTDEFKEKTSQLTKAEVMYGKVDESMWGYPDYINQTYARECREDYAQRHIIYGGSEPYRHMCRFQSGFFFRHPLLDDFEYYWRVEPSINYYCDIDYDVFQMMKDNDYKYGWTLSLTEYKETIPTLWKTTQEFMDKNPDYIVKGDESILPWITDDDYENYNGCHFWSNFEIGSLNFLRSEKYLKFFDFLDKRGGFFYERWGDAPVHSLAVAMMLKNSEVHFFNDIGYYHGPLTHCPTEPYLHKKCHCNAEDNFDWRGWSCLTRYHKLHPNVIWDQDTYMNKTSPYLYYE